MKTMFWRIQTLVALSCILCSYGFAAQAPNDTPIPGVPASAATDTTRARELLFGEPSKRDGNIAVALLRGASATHYGPAEFVLGAVLVSDANNSASMKEGSELLARAGHDGCAGAAGLLGNMLFAAASKHPESEPVALQFLRAGAEGGDSLSQGLLGAAYRRGSPSLPRDLISAYAWAHLASTTHPHQSPRMAKLSAELETRILGELSATEHPSATQRAAQYAQRYAHDSDPFCSQAEDVSKPAEQ